ncbi:hypothetical protein AURANDRAFT_23276 [Aureococcus anophagefferens]|nr:hypothetical protein AURANDRAFT_23276 [Aureococcus anophagefferens]EGB10493.1 hypothetical protein AURANDRAFT_23276 [Aureococcus anophagefferens]|eukprot:XP_009035285.1 hypothetical protein AURANDRAFT_23276 [Aureococcus anophagefferens]
MDRVQRALLETLQREYERTALEAREKAHEVSLSSRTREDTGVELYGTQQQLARLQLALEALHSTAGELAEKRSAEEVGAQEARSRHGSLNKALQDRKKHVAKNQAELDAVNDTLRQVEKYNEEMRKEIAVTKRATYKAEENVQSLEHAKKGQDLYINSLDERVRQLGEQIAVHETQLAKQKAESDEARGMLAETGQEMELIAFEKKQLIQQWKASLVQLTRRDEALSAATQTLQAARMELRDLQTEIDGTKREALGVKADNESLVVVRDRLAREEQGLDEAIGQVVADCEAVSAQFALLQRSMVHTEEEEAKVAGEAKGSGDSLEQLAQNIQIVTVERMKIEQRILAARSASMTVTKAVRNLQKQALAVKERTHEKEITQAHLENELSRIRVDTLNTDAHNSQLRETLEGMVGKLKTQDELIAKYQQEIRQRNDDIEKKMYRVDRLNRKYEKMMEHADDGEHVGPLEATIRNLNKEKESIAVEATQLQGAWLADQTLLVSAAQQTEVTLEKNAELRARARILNERRLQLLKDASKRTVEVTALQNNIKAMRADVARLNDLLGRHATQQEALANETAVTEMEFQSELKELEDESLAMEKRVFDTKQAKAALLEEVVDTERQVMLWEKKIQLERETQAALDPEVGMSEIKAMEIEIHRMRLRLDGLQREQERMIVEMERGIGKREAITLRFKGKQRPTQVEHTKASLKKQVGNLRRTIQVTARDASQLSNAIMNRQKELQESTQNLTAATSRYGDLEGEAQRLQASINGLLYEKQRRAELQTAREHTASRYLDLERGLIEPLTEEHAADVEMELVNSNDGLKQVRNVIMALSSQFDYLAEPLDRIMRLTDDAEQGAITGLAGASPELGAQ